MTKVKLWIIGFSAGYVGSGFYQGRPLVDLLAGWIFFMAVGFGVYHFTTKRLRDPVDNSSTNIQKAARSLRNRPGAMNTDLTGIKPRNKGSVGKHLRWVKK